MRYVLIMVLVGMLFFLATVLLLVTHQPPPLSPGWYIVPGEDTHA